MVNPYNRRKEGDFSVQIPLRGGEWLVLERGIENKLLADFIAQQLNRFRTHLQKQENI